MESFHHMHRPQKLHHRFLFQKEDTRKKQVIKEKLQNRDLLSLQVPSWSGKHLSLIYHPLVFIEINKKETGLAVLRDVS